MRYSIVPVCAVLCLSLSASADGPATYAVPAYAQTVVTGDFNGDGRPDVAVASYGTVSVLLGNGDGTLQAALDSPTGSSEYALAVGDFDQDGRLDLATAQAILLGNGDGTFGPPSYGLYWYTVAVGDLDEDGKADLVGLTEGGCDEYYCYGVVTVQLGQGDGTFSSPSYSWDALAWDVSLTLADYDADGHVDVASTAGLQLGHGDGTLASPSAWCGSAGAADFNGDGKLDAAGTSYGYVYVELGNGDGTFQSGIWVWGDWIGPMTIADFNGDGRPDVAAVTEHEIAVLLGRGDGTLAPAERVEVGYYARSVAAPDLDGDGLPDLAATLLEYPGSELAIVVNDGTWPAFDAPSITIADASVTEGNSGTSALTFTVNLSAAYSRAVTVEYSTTDGTAASPGDYQAVSGTLTIGAGDTSGSVTVLVSGDRIREAPEYFLVNLSQAMNAFLVDGEAVGTIMDDEPRISVTYSVNKAEGNRRQTTPFPFSVALASAYDEDVSVSFRTVASSANKNDYVGRTGALTFRPGETAKTITIDVKGDNRREPDEVFILELHSPSSNAALEYRYGYGWILNDD